MHCLHSTFFCQLTYWFPTIPLLLGILSICPMVVNWLDPKDVRFFPSSDNWNLLGFNNPRIHTECIYLSSAFGRTTTRGLNPTLMVIAVARKTNKENVYTFFCSSSCCLLLVCLVLSVARPSTFFTDASWRSKNFCIRTFWKSMHVLVSWWHQQMMLYIH